MKYLIHVGFRAVIKYTALPLSKICGDPRQQTAWEFPIAFNLTTLSHSLPGMRSSALR